MAGQDPFGETGKVTRIDLYPIKGLEGTVVEQAEVLTNGALKHDRQYTFWSLENDKWERGKSSPEMIKVRTQFDLEAGVVTLKVDGDKSTFSLADTAGREKLNAWMSNFLGKKVELRENLEAGFFDDSALGRRGASMLSAASLDRMCEWFPKLTPVEVIRRMRMNITADGLSPFWEEQIIKEDRSSKLKVGDAVFRDPWVCVRCSVPTRDSYTAEADPGFAKDLSEFREANTPENSPLRALSKQEDFCGYFSLGVRMDGRDAGGSNVIKVGDAVTAV